MSVNSQKINARLIRMISIYKYCPLTPDATTRMKPQV